MICSKIKDARITIMLSYPQVPTTIYVSPPPAMSVRNNEHLIIEFIFITGPKSKSQPGVQVLKDGQI